MAIARPLAAPTCTRSQTSHSPLGGGNVEPSRNDSSSIDASGSKSADSVEEPPQIGTRSAARVSALKISTGSGRGPEKGGQGLSIAVASSS